MSALATTGRCMACGERVTIPFSAAWPEACPHCRSAPLGLSIGSAPTISDEQFEDWRLHWLTREQFGMMTP